MTAVKLKKGILTIAMALPMMGVGLAAAADEPLKVGFIYSSPIGDAGWNTQQDLGRQAVEKTFGDRVVTKYIESVPENSDGERVIRGLARDGYGLIFTTSFGYMNPTLKVAKEFPNVKFVHSTGYQMTPNVAITSARVVWVNTWFDPAKERQAALALISNGADVVTHHTNSTAIVQAAQDKGVYALAYNSDMSKFGPDAQIGAATHHWGKYFSDKTREVLDGTWKSDSTLGGIKDQMVDFGNYGSMVPDDMRQFVEARKAELVDGSVAPFDGPVLDRDGTVRVPAGETMTDEAMGLMDYFVEGVEGTLPKS